MSKEIRNYLKTFGLLIQAEKATVECFAVPFRKVGFAKSMVILTVSPKQMNNFLANVPGTSRGSEHVVKTVLQLHIYKEKT